MALGQEQRRQAMADLGKAWGIALEFIVSILLFTGGGWLLDRWLGTSPWFLIAGMGVGLFGGVYRLLREARALDHKGGGQEES